MNWNQIKKEYPKAWRLLILSNDTFCWDGKILFHKWQSNPPSLVLSTIEYNNRDLYDFFDDMGIFIFIPPTTLTWWDWEIYVNGQCRDSSEVEEPNRKEAENEAFKRAFKILEKKCK